MEPLACCLVRDHEGERHLQEQRDRFTPYIIRYKKQLKRERKDHTDESVILGLLHDPDATGLTDTRKRKGDDDDGDDNDAEDFEDDDGGDDDGLPEAKSARRDRGEAEEDGHRRQYQVRGEVESQETDLGCLRVVESSAPAPRPGEELSRAAEVEAHASTTQVDKLKMMLQTLERVEETEAPSQAMQVEEQEEEEEEKTKREEVALIAQLLKQKAQ